MKKYLPITIFALLPVFCYAQTAHQGDVIINEIAWMGSTDSSYNEWIELKNTTSIDINLAGWILSSDDKKMTAKLSGSISREGFYLMERTKNFIPGVRANTIYHGILSNSGMNLLLFDDSKTVIDRADFINGWPAGDNKTKQTMERTSSLQWQTSKDPNGTPDAQNSSGVVIQPPPQKLVTNTSTIQPLPAKTKLSKNKTANNVLLKSKKSANSDTIDANLASLQTSPLPPTLSTDKENPWLTFLIAIAATIIFASIILFVKIKFIKNNTSTNVRT